MTPNRALLLLALAGFSCAALLAIQPARAQEQETHLLTGAQIRLEFGDGWLQAESGRLTVDDAGNNLWLLKQATYSIPPWRLQAEQLLAKPAERQFSATNIRFEYGETVQGSARKVIVVLENVEPQVTLEDFLLAFCAPDGKGPGWGFKGQQLELAADAQSSLATVKGVSFRLFGVTLPGPPLARLPLDGTSIAGMLPPVIKRSGSSDLDLSIPVLFTFGSALDWTLTPRLIANVGEGVESELRYILPTQQGRMSLGVLEEDDLSWQAWHWGHQAQWGNWGLHLDYAAGAKAGFPFPHQFTTISIPISSGYYQQQLELSWRQDANYIELRSQRLEDAFSANRGDYSRGLELRMRWGEHRGDLLWMLTMEAGRYLLSGSELFFALDWPDRPLGASDPVHRMFSVASVKWRPDATWGWLQLSGSAQFNAWDYRAAPVWVNDADELSDEAMMVTGELASPGSPNSEGDNWQRSLTLQLDAGLRLVAGAVQLQPRLQYRQVDFRSRGVLQNLDSALLPISYFSIWEAPVSGGDLLPSRDRLTAGIDLHAPLASWQLRGTWAQVHYGATAVDSLLAKVEPNLLQSERAQLLELQLSGGRQVRQQLTMRFSQGQRDYDDMQMIAWQLSAGFGSVSLLRSQRKQGAGPNNLPLDAITASLKTKLPGGWRLELAASEDLNNGRRIRESVSVGYENCCIALGISGKNFLTTDIPAADDETWLNWHNLPLLPVSTIAFRFQLKTGIGGKSSQATR